VQTEAYPSLFYSSYKVSAEQAQFKKLGYNVLATRAINGFDDPDGVKSAVEGVLAQTKNIDVVLSDDDSSVQGAVQLKRQGQLPHALIIGDGGDTRALASITQGLEFGTTLSVPRSVGMTAAEKAVALVRGQPVGSTSLTQLDLTHYPIVTKANVAQVTPQW
jgi:ABC-type sugar transport system substrate-binding protein